MRTVLRFPTKEERLSAALEAAKLGQLTRLCEVVVEGVAEEKEDCDDWKLKSSSQVEQLRSSFVQIIHEAAALGSMKQLEPYEVCNWSDTNDEEKESSDEPEPAQDPPTIRPVRRRAPLLMAGFLEQQKSQRQLAVNPLERLEQWEEEEVTRSTTTSWSPGDDPMKCLPSPKVPRIRKRFTFMTRQRLTENLAQCVAEKAHDRAWRIQQENKLKITHKCDCIYCVHPSPMQTQSYQKLRYSQIMGPPKESNKKEPKEVELPTPLVPTFVKPTMDRCGSEKELMTEVFQKVAAKAWDRQMKLQRRGSALHVTHKCICTYCGHASPQQTEQYKALAQSPQVQRRRLSVSTSNKPASSPICQSSKGLISPMAQHPLTLSRSQVIPSLVSPPSSRRVTLSPSMLRKTITPSSSSQKTTPTFLLTKQQTAAPSWAARPAFKKAQSVPRTLGSSCFPSWSSPDYKRTSLRHSSHAPKKTETIDERSALPPPFEQGMDKTKTKIKRIPSPPPPPPLEFLPETPKSSKESLRVSPDSVTSDYFFLQEQGTPKLDDAIDEEEILRLELSLPGISYNSSGSPLSFGCSLLPPPPLLL
jgi:hypothetical protein